MLWAVALASLASISAGCASTGAVPKPFPMPGAAASSPGETRPVDAAAEAEARPAIVPDAYALVGTALDLRGVRYRNGGADPAGFDCSGFTHYVFAQYGVTLPREVRDQYNVGAPVRPEDLAPGDLVFFTTTAAGPSHVAIAVGGIAFVHAPSTTGVVRVERLDSSYWSGRFVGARRVTQP